MKPEEKETAANTNEAPKHPVELYAPNVIGFRRRHSAHRNPTTLFSTNVLITNGLTA